MAGIYIHIPFCKQACYYCDFHFSTSLKKKNILVDSLIKEIQLRKNELNNEQIETIYFGGGTPSLLSQQEIDSIINAVYEYYSVNRNPEITLEANPDDLTQSKIVELSRSKVNRLSIGIQSFIDRDLQLMNRAHNSEEAKKSLDIATQFFENISLDLIYGIPNSSNEDWRYNIETALLFNIPHVSSYALTVEPKTALETFIKKKVISEIDEEQAQEQFYILVAALNKADFEHYELSNFGKKGFFSKNNSAYWQGKSYLGIGPSAHSYNGKQRGWNVRNNTKYIKAIQENQLPIEREMLSITDQYNEYIMTRIRTKWGISLIEVQEKFGELFLTYLKNQAEKYISQQFLYVEKGVLRTTKKGLFLADGIASDLFKINIH